MKIAGVLASLFRIVAGVVVLLIAGMVALAVVNGKPLDFASGLLTVAGAVGGFTALTYAHASTLEVPYRAWFNREARNLFQGAVLWGYAALLSYFYSLIPTATLPAWFASALFTFMTCLLGVLLLFAALMTFVTVEWILEGLSDPEDIDALQARTSRGRLARVLGRAVKPADVAGQQRSEA